MKLISLILSIFFVVGCMTTPRMYNSKLKSAWPQKMLGSYYAGNGFIHFKNDSNIIGLILVPNYYFNADSLTDSLYAPIQILPAGKTSIEDIQTVYLYNISYIKI